MPYDPMYEAAPLWLRAAAAVTIIVAGWFLSRDPVPYIPAEPDEEARASHIDDWDWPAR